MERESYLENMEMMEFFHRKYSGKRVLVTGHTGFKGGWLCIWLEMLGAKVSGYALDPIHDDGIFNCSGICSRINDIRGDIRDLQYLERIFLEIQPEIVFHLAAQAIVIEGYRNPVETFEINIQGTVNVLEAIRKTPTVKAAVIITTDKCYENREWEWGYRENEQMGGLDPYSASKGAAELVINAYRHSYFTNLDGAAIASARAGNVIGGGDWAENRLVPDIFRSIAKKESICLRNPNSIRPWQHVLEPLGGYLLLGVKLLEQPKNYAEAWNFGPYAHFVYSTNTIAEQIIEYIGSGISKDVMLTNSYHEAHLLLLDINKAIIKMGWKPVLDFKGMIKLTCDWYLNYKNANVLKMSQLQIHEYIQKWK
jgi:CDP-glucose 4,6-dehydratase